MSIWSAVALPPLSYRRFKSGGWATALQVALLLIATSCASTEFERWTVPGQPRVTLALVEKAPDGVSYGPQLVALDAQRRVLHESGRLFDDDFVRPTFFAFPDRTLVLADHGSEDAYGILAWSIENGTVRDLGELEVALPEDEDVFTRGAAATASVALRDGAYVITIAGPLLLDPRGRNERLLAKEGEVATFRESAGRFELVQPR